jgi:hypothetical protein
MNGEAASVATRCALCKEPWRGMNDGYSICCGSTMTELQRAHGFSDVQATVSGPDA